MQFNHGLLSGIIVSINIATESDIAKSQITLKDNIKYINI